MFARDTLVFLKALAELFGRGLLILSTRRGNPCLPQQSLCIWLRVFPQGRDCVSEFVSLDGETWWGSHIPIAVPWSLRAEELAGRLVLSGSLRRPLLAGLALLGWPAPAVVPCTCLPLLWLPFPRSAATPALRVPCQVCFVDRTLCTVLAECHLGLHPWGGTHPDVHRGGRGRAYAALQVS